MKRGKSKTSLKNSKNVKIAIGILALVLISAVFVYAGYTLGGKGFIVPKYSSEEVSAYSDCVKVTNNLALDLFIPLNTSAEWNFFRNAILPSGLTKGTCTPCDPTCYACGVQNECGDNCGCPSDYECISGECLDCYGVCDSELQGCKNLCFFGPCLWYGSTDDRCQQCNIQCQMDYLEICLPSCTGGIGGGGGSTPPIPLPN